MKDADGGVYVSDAVVGTLLSGFQFAIFNVLLLFYYYVLVQFYERRILPLHAINMVFYFISKVNNSLLLFLTWLLKVKKV